MTSIELLAPARDLESVHAAIDCGADAVYIGGPSFGARHNAANTVADIQLAAQYAHRYNAKLYVTLNTILTDREIEQARKLMYQLNSAGIDALIIQDMGLLELDLPPLPLIASTQMHNHTPERVKFLEDTGFSRAILARELSLEEIKTIRAATTIELECFIHGALCVSYSGQCALSYAIGGRSGNRGECAQPCRLETLLTDSDGVIISAGKHLLSLKDLSLAEEIPALIEAGVTSFKIEGRLKDTGYVKNVTAFYRTQIDRALEGTPHIRSSEGKSFSGFTPDINKTFNRGYCSYNFHGSSRGIGSIDTPKFMGEHAGSVTSAGKEYFTLNTEHSFSTGDGISFLGPKEILCGTQIVRIDGKNIYPDEMYGIRTGTDIYINYDRMFIKSLESAKTERRLNVSLELSIKENALVLTACDDAGNSFTAETEYTGEKARDAEKAEQVLREQLGKLGSTYFVLSKLTLPPEMPFVPLKTINDLRRRAVEGLSALRENSYSPKRIVFVPNSVPYPEKEISAMGNVHNTYAEKFYTRHGAVVTERAYESGTPYKGKTVLTSKYCLLAQIGLCRKDSARLKDKSLVLTIADAKFNVFPDCSKCVMTIAVS